MKIVVLNGSPHRSGTTDLLISEFIAGAEEAGHEVFRFDAAFHDIHPCLGCDMCGMNGPCVQKDDIEKDLIGKLVETDLIVLASPVYYYHVSAQLKTLIDRFYARTGRISDKKSVLLAAAQSNNEDTFKVLRKYYSTLTGYMRWKSQGMVLAPGCGTRADIEKTAYPQQARELGKKL